LFNESFTLEISNDDEGAIRSNYRFVLRLCSFTSPFENYESYILLLNEMTLPTNFE
jgi:hypothetical protein